MALALLWTLLVQKESMYEVRTC